VFAQSCTFDWLPTLIRKNVTEGDFSSESPRTHRQSVGFRSADPSSVVRSKGGIQSVCSQIRDVTRNEVARCHRRSEGSPLPHEWGMGLRLTVKIEDKIYEVHVAPVKFVKLRKRATRRAIPSRSSVLAQNFKAGMPSCPARSRTAATIWYSATKTAPIWQ